MVVGSGKGWGEVVNHRSMPLAFNYQGFGIGVGS